jgi:DNA-binding CsgD family transcriptional regulator
MPMLVQPTLVTLIEAIKAVASGGTYLYAPLVAALTRDTVGENWRSDSFELLEPLTAREREILKLMASSISDRAIAEALTLSKGTVKNHVSSVFSRMGVTVRTKAVLRAIAQGLVQGLLTLVQRFDDQRQNKSQSTPRYRDVRPDLRRLCEADQSDNARLSRLHRPTASFSAALVSARSKPCPQSCAMPRLESA